MAQIATNQFKAGLKVEVDGQPWVIVGVDFVKPGKGQAFTRVKLKGLLTGRVIERTYKSGEKIELADVAEAQMRFSYRDGQDAVFMDDQTYEQLTVPHAVIADSEQWLKEDLLYEVISYKGAPVLVNPPTFIDMEIVETEPGVKGDTASGRVLKAAITDTGAKVQVPIFIDQHEVVKIDTRTGEYVSRSSK
ncbi:MAG: elongation factor P [Parachlamydiales bacterium]